MKTLLFSLILLATPPLYADSAEACHCKCVAKEDDKYTTVEAQAPDRETAGEALKKALGKKKCELSPVCTGGC